MGSGGSPAYLGETPTPAGRSAPDLPGRLHDQLELRHLLRDIERVALHRGGEAALRREAELLERYVPRCLVDPALERVLVLQLTALGGHQPEHDLLARRDEAE